MHVLEVEADQLTQTQAGGVEHLEHRAIAAAERRRHVGRLEQGGHLGFAQMPRHGAIELRRHGRARRVAFDESFAVQVAQERAHSRQLARHRRARLLRAIQLDHEAAHRVGVEVGEAQRRHLRLARGRRARQILVDVARVGAHRVRRQMAVECQMLDERLERVSHRSQAARSARARSASACLRKALSRGGWSSGGMMPNVMFEGW